MLRIKQEQMNLIGSDRVNMYIASLAEFCHEKHADSIAALYKVFADLSLEEFIRTQIPIAQSFGLVSSKHISEYIVLSLRFLPSTIEDCEWLKIIFAQTAKNNTTKMAELMMAYEIEVTRLIKDTQ